MTQDFEYDSYNDVDRIAILENRAAELERRLSGDPCHRHNRLTKHLSQT